MMVSALLEARQEAAPNETLISGTDVKRPSTVYGTFEVIDGMRFSMLTMAVDIMSSDTSGIILSVTSNRNRLGGLSLRRVGLLIDDLLTTGCLSPEYTEARDARRRALASDSSAGCWNFSTPCTLLDS